MPRTAAHLVNGGTLALFIASSIAWGHSRFLMIGLGVAAAMYGTAWLVGWLVDHYPECINAPNQAKYDALPPSGKCRVMAVVQRWICWETAGLLAVLLLLHLLDGSSSLAGSMRETYTLVGILGFVMGSTAAAPFLIWRVSATIDDLHDRAEPSPQTKTDRTRKDRKIDA